MGSHFYWGSCVRRGNAGATLIVAVGKVLNKSCRNLLNVSIWVLLHDVFATVKSKAAADKNK